MRDPPHPAPAEGGTGSVGLPMDVTPQRDARCRISACYCAPSRSHPVNGPLLHAPAHPLPAGEGRFVALMREIWIAAEPDSYTHMTLPTNREVKISEGTV